MKAQVLGLWGILLLAASALADPPYIQPIPDWEIEEDAMLTVNIVVEDGDSSELLYWAEVDTPNLTVNFDVVNMQVHCQPHANWSGTATVTVGVDDMDGARNLTTEEFQIHVMAVNDCPRRLSNMPPAAYTVNEDQCLELSLAQLRSCFSDADWAFEGDTLDFLNYSFSAGTAVATAGGVRLCPQADMHGNATLSLRATDGECGLNSTIPIKVMPVNDCPVQVAEWEMAQGFEDTDLVLNGLLNAFHDVDLDALTYCIIDDGQSGFRSDWSRTGVLTIHPPAEFSGSWELFVCITDGVCQVGDVLQINLAAVNDAPSLPATTSLSLDEDGSLSQAYPVSDVDSPQIYVEATSSTAQMAVAWNQGSLSLTPAADWNGPATVTLRACDAPDGGGACREKTLAVTVQPVNDAPQLAALANAQLAEDGQLVVVPLLTDIDSPNLSVSAGSSAPQLEAHWQDESGELRLIPAADWYGQAVVSVTVEDGDGGSAQDEFQVEVAPVNDSPVLPASQALSLDEDATLQLAWPVMDVDGPQLAVEVLSDTPELSAGWLDGQLQLAASGNWNGQANLTLQACDGYSTPQACLSQNLSVTVHPVNDGPSISQLDDVSFLEDSVWQQAVSLDDIDSAELTVTVESAAGQLVASWLEEGSLRLAPQADWHGSALVTVTVNDQAARAVAQRSFTATVLPVNDAPVLPAALNLEMAEDGSLGVDFAPQDVDGPLSLVTVESDQAEVSVSWLAESGRIQVLPAADWFGEASLTVTVCDGDPGHELCAQRELSLNVLPVNDAPILPELAPLSLSEDGSLLLALPLADVDGPQVQLAVECSEPSLTALWLPESSQLQLTPAPDWNGQAQIGLTLCDGHATHELCDEATLDVTVLASNDAPLIEALADQSLPEDGSLLLPVTLHDIDSGELLVTLQSDREEVALSWLAESGQMRAVPAADWSGQALLTVSVSDEASRLLASTSFHLTVTPINDAPILPELAPLSLSEDGSLLLAVPVVDVDGPQVQLTVLSSDSSLAALWLPESSQLQLTPAPDWNGQAQIGLTVCDGHETNELCDQATLDVTVLAANDAPLIEALADQSLPEDGSLLLPVTLHDIDSGELVVTLQSDREEVALSWLAESGQLQAVPAADWFGQALLTVSVSDEASRLLASTSFNLSVTPVNDAPVWPDLDELLIVEDTPTQLELAVTDVDGPSLAITVLSDTPNLQASWNPESGQLQLVPVAQWTGQAQLSLSACDAFPDAPACTEHILLVTVTPLNDAPWIGEVADQTLEEDGSLALPLVLSDVDSQDLLFSWSAEPAVMDLSWNEQESLLGLAPQADWSGVCSVTLSLDDQEGRSVATREFQVTVNPVNDSPYVRPCLEWSCGVVEDAQAFHLQLQEGALTLDVADVDGDPLQLIWYVDGVEVSRHELDALGDTLSCWSLPAPPAEWLEGEIVLHAELNDGNVSLNPGGESCAWELDFTDLGGVTPLSLALAPAWPNPFNPATHIPFTLAAAGEVRLLVYDLRGARVAVLAEGWRTAGRHEVLWEAGRLASGVYLAVLEAGGERLVQRLTLLK